MRGTRVAAALAALTLLLSGCSDDEPMPRVEPSVSPTPSGTTTSPSVEPSDPVEPTMPAAAMSGGRRGAEAFVVYFWDVANYAQESGDVDALAALANELCSACNAAIGSLRDVFKAGGSVQGGVATVSNLRTQVLTAGDKRVYRVTFQLSTTRQVIRVPGRPEDNVFPAATARDRFVVDRQSEGWLVGIWEVLS